MYRAIPVLVLLAGCPLSKDDTADTATDDTGVIDDTATTFTPAPAGDVSVCITNDTSLDWYDVLRFEATVVSEDVYTASLPYGKCWGSDLSRAIEVIDGDGVTWQLAWKLTDPDGLDVTPTAALTPGSTVDVSAGMACGEGCAWAFSVSESDAVVVAGAEGYWYPALDPEDLPGMTVSEGAVLGEAEDGCGLLAYTSVVFTGDTDTVELEPWEEGDLLVGGQSVHLWAVDSAHYVREDCTDLGDMLSWAVAR